MRNGELLIVQNSVRDGSLWSNIIFEKDVIFSKTKELPREPFLTMFYTTNLSPLLAIKQGFMLINILSNYQYDPLPLSSSMKLGPGVQ